MSSIFIYQMFLKTIPIYAAYKLFSIFFAPPEKTIFPNLKYLEGWNIMCSLFNIIIYWKGVFIKKFNHLSLLLNIFKYWHKTRVTPRNLINLIILTLPNIKSNVGSLIPLERTTDYMMLILSRSPVTVSISKNYKNIFEFPNIIAGIKLTVSWSHQTTLLQKYF